MRRASPGRRLHAVFLGFCFGERNSWLAAASGHGLAGAVGFYGRPGRGRPLGTPGPVQRVAEMEAPILALQGGDDPGIPEADSKAFDDALEAAGVEHEVVIYSRAPHSFFDRKQDEFAAESEDAWNRVLAFLGATRELSADGRADRVRGQVLPASEMTSQPCPAPSASAGPLKPAFAPAVPL